MSTTAPSSHDPYAALRYPEFVALAGVAFLLDCGMLMQATALGYELYRVTRDPLALGLVGLAEAVPFMTLALLGGHISDRRERRGLVRMALCVMVVGSSLVALLASQAGRAALPQGGWLLAIYALVALFGFSNGFLSPAASSLRAQLVPREVYGNSATWWSAAYTVGGVLGPVIGGFLYAWVGLTGAAAVVAAMYAMGVALISCIRPRPVEAAPDEGPDKAGLWESLREGFAYLATAPLVLYSIALDMVSVMFGGVTAILPVFASDILQVGPQGLGLLRSATAVGALLTLLICTHLPPLGKPWRNLLLAVAGFGLATMVFALSPWFWLSLLALAAAGGFDSVSMIIRNTILQAVPPDHVRGRVMAVNSIFISASNDLGAFESGLAARLLGTVPSVLLGAVATWAIVGWTWSRTRSLLGSRL